MRGARRARRPPRRAPPLRPAAPRRRTAAPAEGPGDEEAVASSRSAVCARSTQRVVCDEDALTIKRYYFSIGAKRVEYKAIRDVREGPIGPLIGSWRIWGMGPAPYWFHLDTSRPKKGRALTLDVGSLIKVVITPDDHDAVAAILRERAGARGSP